MTGALTRDRGREDTDTRRPREDGGRGWSYVAASQGTPRVARIWKKQGKILSWILVLEKKQALLTP